MMHNNHPKSIPIPVCKLKYMNMCSNNLDLIFNRETH